MRTESLREVKNNLFPLEPLAAARAVAPGIRLRFVGSPPRWVA